MKFLSFGILLGLMLQSAPAGLIMDGASLEKLADGFLFTEGPAADKAGNVYFTDQPNDRIMKWGIDGKLSTFMQPSGRANGLCFDRKGRLWAAADEKNELWRISPNGKVRVVLKNYEGKRFNGPNDIWIAPNGNLYFTDPFYKRNYWKRGDKEMKECVYLLAKNGKVTRVIDNLEQPNGIIGTPDGKRLYVADIKGKATYRFDILENGLPGPGKLHCSMGSDGMTIDDQGNIYLTGRGVFVFSPTGEQLEHIEVPEPWTANVCFGGKNRDRLFITASKGLYSIQMKTRGVDSQ